MSGDEPGDALVVVPRVFDRLVSVLGRLTAPEMPAVALIGGMAVNIRLSTAADAHRVTQDVDLVADEAAPTAIEVLSEDAEVVRDNTVVARGVEIQIIETHPINVDDLGGLDDDGKLFVVGHRWALDTASDIRIATTADAQAVTVPVATPAGLVATKSHAAGYPRAARRATKHGGDLYDIFRLVEVFDARGELRTELAGAPGGLGQLVADVVDKEILADPGRALRQMLPASSTALDAQQVVEVFEPFVAALR